MAKRKRRKPHERQGFKLGKRGSEWVIDCRGNRDYSGPKRIKLRGPGEDEAKAQFEQWIESYAVVRRQQASYTVGQLWGMWLREREADKLCNDIYGANWVALKPAFALRAPDLLTTQDYRQYAQARFDAGRAPWTVHTELVRLRACFKWAAEHHHIARRPKVWVPSPGKHRDRVLSIAEAGRLVAGAKEGDPHVELFVVVAFATGARHRAILDLIWDRIDFVHGLIHFDENLKPDPMSKSWRKGRALVPMNRAVRAALEVAYEGRQSKYVIEHGGRRLKSVRDGFANAVGRAGLSGVTPHTIRHTVASWLEDRVGDARRAQLLGHSGLRTLPAYTHSGAAMLTEAVSYLDFAPLPRIEESRPDG